MNRPHPLRLLIVFGLLWASVASAQVARIEYDDTAAVLDRIDAVMTTLEEVQAGLDRTAFDADELAFELAFEDAETIIDWVSDGVAFQPYAGVLRGPDGTLRARAGNAFDQALLLSRLLNDAGYETRIAVTTLTEEDAERLLTLSETSVPSLPDLGDVDAIRSALARLADLLGDDEDVLAGALDGVLDPVPLAAEDVLSELREIEDGILAALEADAVELGVEARSALVSDVVRYAWTEYRFAPDDPWTSAHPTGFQPGAPLEAEEVLTDTVPETYQHRVRIQAWIEAKAGGELTIEPVMAPWERPVANTDHIVVDYANVPDQGTVGTAGEFDLAGLADGAQAFVPNLFGNIAPGALFFDVDGRVLEPEIAGSQAAGVFRSLAANSEGALGALGSIGSDEPADDAFALTAHGIDVTLIAPGGEETVYRRWIVDRIGPEARASGDVVVDADAADLESVARTLLGRHRIMVSTGATTPAFVLDRTIERLLETRALLELMATRLADGASDLEIDSSLLPGAPGLDHLGALDAFDRTLADVDSGPGYRPSPAVLILSETVTPNGEGFRRSVDIVTNPRRILTEGPDGVAVDARAALRRGAWETMVEREMLLGVEAAVPPADRVNSLAAADVRGPYTVLAPGAIADPQVLGVDAMAAARIQDDLDRGAIVVVGSLPDGGAPAWWRVDPISGVALGITADGRGQSMTEYTIKLYDAGFTVMFAVKGISDCIDVPSGPPRACCLLKAHLSNVAGMGLGGIVGGALGGGAGLIFGVVTGVAGVDWSDGLGLDCAAFGAGY